MASARAYFNTFKRITELGAGICAKWIRLVWKRARITWTKVYLLLALANLIALAVSGNWLFIVFGVVLLLLAMTHELDRNERLERVVFSPAGLQTMILIEAGCLAIAVISVARFPSYMQEIRRLNDEAQSIAEVRRLNQQLREAGLQLGAFVSLPMMIVSSVAHTLKTHKENPFVIELKSTPLWKFQRAMPVVVFVAEFGMLIVNLLQ